MKKTPFSRIEQDLKEKSQFLDTAKKLYEEDNEVSKFTSALFFINLADYIATHLLDGLQDSVELATESFYQSHIKYRFKRLSDQPLGKVRVELNKFEFAN